MSKKMTVSSVTSKPHGNKGFVKYLGIISAIAILTFAKTGFCGNGVSQSIIAPTGLLISGIGIGTVWTLDLISQKNLNMNGNLFKARDKSTNQLLWPHLLAEYVTAGAAVASAVGLYRDEPWASSMTLIASGLLAYTSVNSMAWVLSEKGRIAYAIPMMIGLTSAGFAIAVTF